LKQTLSAAPVDRRAIGRAAAAYLLHDAVRQIGKITGDAPGEANSAAADAFHVEMLIKMGNGQILKLDVGRHSAPLKIKN